MIKKEIRSLNINLEHAKNRRGVTPEEITNIENKINLKTDILVILDRNEPVAVRVETYEYRTNKYFCPVCGKQQKQSFKNFDKGCFCERCGQKLLPLRS